MKNQAFTLIELLVVVLIIGILAAIAVPQYEVAVWKSRFSTIKNLAQSIAQAEEAYFLANGDYTKDFEALDLKVPTPNSSRSFSDSDVYYYDWGYCALVKTNVNNVGLRGNIQCSVYKDGSEYIMYNKIFSQSKWRTNEVECVAFGPNRKPNSSDASYKVCDQETGGNFVGGFGGYSDYWVYQ